MRILRVPAHIYSKKVNALAIDEESGVLASAGDDGLISLWDIKTLLEVTNLEAPTSEDIEKAKPHSTVDTHEGNAVSCLEIWGEWLISSDIRGDVYKTDIKELKSQHLFKAHSEINDIVMAHGVGFFASLNKVLTYDFNLTKQIDPIPSRSDVRSLSIDPTNSYLTSIGFNRQISVHQINYIEDQLLFKKIPTGGQQLSSINEVCKVSWSPTGEHFAVPNFGTDPQSAGIGIVSRVAWKTAFSLYGHNCNVVRFCPSLFELKGKNYNIIASSGIDKSIAVWNTTHQRPLFTAADVSQNSINDLQWTKNGSGLFAATDTILIFAFDENELGKIAPNEKVLEIRQKVHIPEPLKPKEKPVEVTVVEEEKPSTNGKGSEIKQGQNNDHVKPTKQESVPPSVTSVKATPTPTPPPAPPAATTTKNGKKRIAPTLISAVNGSKAITTQPSTNNTTNGDNGTITTMEFDVPSYSVPKELKRKEEFDSDQQRKRREVEAVEFIGSAVINPSSSFAKVRISTPKIRSFFTLKSPNDESLSLDIRNGSGNEQKPTRITLYKNETKQIFVDFIPKLAGLATGGEGEFWAVSTMDGVLYVYSDSGRRIFPPVVLGTPLSFLESKGKYLMAITSIGEVFAWDVPAKKALFEPTSLYPLLSRSNPDLLTRAENLTLCSISASGTPVVTVSNGNGYLFDKDMETWILISDSWWAFGSQYWDSRGDKSNGSIVNLLEGKTNDEIVRRGRGKFLQKMAKTMLMKEGYENLEKIISLAHLENRILISQKLKEGTEFKNYMIMYCKRISEMDYKAKLIEIFQELLGPKGLVKNDNWDPKILSFEKHDLLREIIFACANIRSVQRILVQFATSLGILDQVAL